MVIKRQVAYGIVEGLSVFWKCEELQDFTVTLGITKFGCHRFLLAACSGFFRRLFRYGMKETELKCVTVEDISSETFELILETLYTGHDVLTNDNVTNIWEAAHQLQIPFVITECEEFAKTSLSLYNYIEYYKIAKRFESKEVLDIVWAFILKHAFHFFKTDFFLEMKLLDVLNLIKSQDLETTSEDVVVHALLKWLEFRPCLTLTESEGLTKSEYATKSEDSTKSEYATKSEGSTKSEYATKSEGSTKSEYATKSEGSTKSEYATKSEGSTKSEYATKSEGLTKSEYATKSEVYSKSEYATKSEDSTKSEYATKSEGSAKSEDSTMDFGRSIFNMKRNKEGCIRKQHLPDLLLNTRTCLLSPSCLEMLIGHPLVKETKAATDIIIKSIMYQVKVGQRNEQWPSGAIYRSNGNYVNIAITTWENAIGAMQIKAFAFLSKKWFKLPDLFSGSSVTFIAYEKSLYAIGQSISVEDEMFSGFTSRNKQVFKLSSHNWSKVNVSLGVLIKPSAVVVDAFIYVLSPENKKIWQLDPATEISIEKTDLPFVPKLRHVVSYEQFIIVFYLSANEDKTKALCFDTSQNTWTSISVFNHPTTGMISFKHSCSTYLLLNNGNLYLFESQPRDFQLKYLAKLWSCEWSLHGAVAIRDEIYIYGVKSEALKEDFQKQTSLEGIFSQIVYMESKDTVPSTFKPATLSRESLVEK
ncbi:uncharacterized protein LOC106051522 [Biomphalaria glabrata]|uniref:Uncharacterized protein LOC106051522 n=1 Tax=Biomphalaria glabrata TaxID=6526 RepID=A0A9U8DV61_BIOGL|nr:uncharacterized protein LOC106051522 [Biomphalaria glabrata]